MQGLTGYHDKLCELSSEIVNHGWGKFEMTVSSTKDNSVKVEISCGKSYVFFIKKEILFDDNKIF